MRLYCSHARRVLLVPRTVLPDVQGWRNQTREQGWESPGNRRPVVRTRQRARAAGRRGGGYFSASTQVGTPVCRGARITVARREGCGTSSGSG